MGGGGRFELYKICQSSRFFFFTFYTLTNSIRRISRKKNVFKGMENEEWLSEEIRILL